jgi:hypothetical protein
VRQALRSGLRVCAASSQFAAEVEVLAVCFLERGLEGCDALAVLLLLQTVDLACQREHERALGVRRDGGDGAGAGFERGPPEGRTAMLCATDAVPSRRGLPADNPEATMTERPDHTRR